MGHNEATAHVVEIGVCDFAGGSAAEEFLNRARHRTQIDALDTPLADGDGAFA